MFVVGVDRDVVDSVVIKHYDTHGLGKKKARQYLDKIFQVEIQIPPSEQQMKEFLDRQVNALDKSTGGYWKAKLTDDYRKALEIGIRELAKHNPRETKRLLNSALLRGRAAADNPDLCEKHDESLLFAQGVQLFLIQRIVQNWISNGSNLLREDEALEWFEDWSEMACKFPKFKPPIHETGDDDVKLSKEKEQPQSDIEKAYEELKKVRLDGDDLKAVDKLLLLEDNLLWQLLRIPFSTEVAMSTTKLQESKPEPVVSTSISIPTVASAPEDLIGLLPSVIRDRIAKEIKKPVTELTSTDLRNVTELSLIALEISDADLIYLINLTSLKKLFLSGAKVTAEGIGHLAKLKSIKNIGLFDMEITDAALTQLAQILQLETLNLMSCRITDDALEQLAKFNAIDTLLLDGSQITDARLERLVHMANIKKLTGLSLSANKITNVGLTNLKNLTQLQRLYLDRTEITDAGLEHLVTLTSLNHLWLGGTKVTDHAIAKLKER